METDTALFGPMVVQALLTLAVYPVLMLRRRATVRETNATFSEVADGKRETEAASRTNRHLANQFELPVLFYAACLALTLAGPVGWWPALLAWAFALSRIAHSIVHLGPNVVMVRGAFFALGMLAVGLLWLTLAVRAIA